MGDPIIQRKISDVRAGLISEAVSYPLYKQDIQNRLRAQTDQIATNNANIRSLRSRVAADTSYSQIKSDIHTGTQLASDYRLTYERNHPRPPTATPDIIPILSRLFVFGILAGTAYIL